jgi:multiple sugar transport system substrate-binding protein
MEDKKIEVADVVSSPLSRRQFLLGGALAVGGAVALGSGTAFAGPLRKTSAMRAPAGSSGTVTFWDMEWGASAYSLEGAALAKQYNKMYPMREPVAYQATTWTGWYQKFASAIASHTNPNCSSGAGYQAFQFSDAGAIQPLDDLVAMLEKDGVAEDFIPSALHSLKYHGFYVAIPWELDIRVPYYRKSVLKSVGMEPPTSWADLLKLGAALKKQGKYLLATAGNPSFNGWQFFPAVFMLGNGGGFFNTKGDLDCLSPENMEAVEFMLQLSKDGYIDPKSVAYDQTDFQNQFGSGAVGLSVGQPKWLLNFSAAVAADAWPCSPIKSNSGKVGTLFWINNLMVYNGNKNLESVYEWYASYESLMRAYWEKGLVGGLPVRRSFGSIPAVRNDPTMRIPLDEWVPIAKTTASQGTELSGALNSLEGSTALPLFTQQLISGSGSAKSILTTLQQGLAESIA